jgi:translation initiation factor IF-1
VLNCFKKELDTKQEFNESTISVTYLYESSNEIKVDCPNVFFKLKGHNEGSILERLNIRYKDKFKFENKAMIEFLKHLSNEYERHFIKIVPFDLVQVLIRFLIAFAIAC